MRFDRSTFSLKAFLYFFHSTNTIIISFLPLYFKEGGLSTTQIGWLLAIGPFAAVISQPIGGYMSDKYHTVKKVILVCLFGMLISSTILFQMNSFVTLMLLTYILFSYTAPIGALGDSLVQRTSNKYRVAFGSIRMWGSIGFAMTSLVSGQILTVIGVGNILYVYLFYGITALIFCMLLTDINVSNKKVSITDAAKMLKDPRVSLFLCTIVFITLAHRTNDSFLGIYIKNIGGNEALIGWAWFIGVTTEAVVFWTSHLWYRRLHELTFVMLAGVIYGIRFIALSLLNDPIYILFVQPLHGVTFGIFYTASFQYMTKIVPKELQGTGQLLLLTVFFGFSGIIGSLFGGMVMDFMGGKFLYRLVGLSALLGSISVLIYKIKQKLPLDTRSNSTV